MAVVPDCVWGGDSGQWGLCGAPVRRPRVARSCGDKLFYGAGRIGCPVDRRTQGLEEVNPWLGMVLLYAGGLVFGLWWIRLCEVRHG